MARRVDVAVVGGGVMGAATAYALRRSGVSALLVEQFRIPHARGSSHGDARIFRLVYDDVRYSRLAQRALPLWRELERACGDEVLRTTGSADAGPGTELRARMCAEAGVAHELVDGEEVERRYGLRFDGPVLLQREGGVLHAERAWRAFAAGVEVAAETRVERLELDGHVRLVTAGEAVEARAAVVTAGPWAPKLLEPLGIHLPLLPTRETVSYFALAPEAAIPTLIDTEPPPAEARLPERSEGCYALPTPRGLKVGVHRGGPEADPDGVGAPHEPSMRVVSEWVARHVPQARPEPLESETCFYTNTPDHSFVLERHGQLVVGSPCSGHGFKFAPAIGEDLAALALEALEA